MSKNLRHSTSTTPGNHFSLVFIKFLIFTILWKEGNLLKQAQWPQGL
ncbi:MAG: hypothetical protein ABI653_02450 [Bacteroidota bacterium]